MSQDTRRAVDLEEIQALLNEALDLTEELSVIPRPHGTGRERSAALAEVGKRLLYLSHVCDKARVATLDKYHAQRGFTPTNSPD